MVRDERGGVQHVWRLKSWTESRFDATAMSDNGQNSTPVLDINFHWYQWKQFYGAFLNSGTYHLLQPLFHKLVFCEIIWAECNIILCASIPAHLTILFRCRACPGSAMLFQYYNSNFKCQILESRLRSMICYTTGKVSTMYIQYTGYILTECFPIYPDIT